MPQRFNIIRAMTSEKTAFIRYLTSGKKAVFRNEQEYPLQDMVHPLIYNDPSSKKSEILKIPMAYHSQRYFSKIVKQLIED